MAARLESQAGSSVVRLRRITVHYERAALSRKDARAFAALAAKGLRALERLAGLPARTRLRFELHAAARISTARGRTILLSTSRVAARSAPYLHEMAHALLPCCYAPPWFSEGLACYLECHLSERRCGYDSRLFTQDGNRGIHAHAARWLADPRGRMVLPFVGTRGAPRSMVDDRHNVAAPFYVLSHSFVKWLADQAGLPSVIRLARARGFSPVLRRSTGKSAASWRSLWLASLPQLPASPQSPNPR